jgi:hypothetical protein
MIHCLGKGGIVDIERTIEFLLDQVSHHEARLAKIEESFLQLNAIVLDVASSEERTNEIVAVLAERQVQTEQMLQSLIQTVERHIATHP